MVFELFDVLLNSVWQSFVQDFCIYVHQWHWPVVFFFYVVFVWFWYHADDGLIEWDWKFPSSAIFWKNFRRIGISYSLNVWQNSPVKPSGPGLLFLGRFLITASISVLVIVLFIISISSWFSLGRWNFSKNLLISSRLSILFQYSCS